MAACRRVIYCVRVCDFFSIFFFFFFFFFLSVIHKDAVGGLSLNATGPSRQAWALYVLNKRDVALGMPRRHLATTSASSTTSLAPDEPLFPYGESDFVSIRKNGQFFVDKTRFLREMEKQKTATFLRPPRFGKSFFVTMLAAYVDIATTDEQYDRWFGGTDIYEVRRILILIYLLFVETRFDLLILTCFTAWETKSICAFISRSAARFFNRCYRT